jgi:uncharacterized protein YigA (DUF484 family)
MDEIHDTLKENQLLARKFEMVEKRLIGISSPVRLFEHLLGQIEKEFSVPFVWVSLTDKGPLSGIAGALKASALLKDRISVVEEAVLLGLTGQAEAPVLANTDLNPFFKLLPGSIKYFLKSLAVVPLTVDGTLAGSLNLGDYSSGRYRPGMDTDLLKHLAGFVSSRLSAAGAPEEASGTPGSGKTGENDGL